MTAKIATLLLLPHPDHAGLLAPGPCWSCPPLMCRRIGRAEWERPPALGAYYGDGWLFALVLAHDGEPVTAGCDLLDRAATPGVTHPAQVTHYGVAMTLAYGSAAAACAGLARWVANNGLGTLLALDPAGRDVTDEVLRG